MMVCRNRSRQAVTRIQRNAIVPFKPAQMYDLINKVEGYPMRFAWCADARVLERGEGYQIARLDLRFAGMVQSFTTRNMQSPPERLQMQLIEGPLQALDGIFSFTPLGDAGCRVGLDLGFAFAGRLWGPALRLGFQGLADRLVDDFCAEARRAYV